MIPYDNKFPFLAPAPGRSRYVPRRRRFPGVLFIALCLILLLWSATR